MRERAGELDGRLERLGFQEPLRRAASAWQNDFVRGGPGGLPWSHLFDFPPGAHASEQDWVEVAAMAMGHALKALEARWPKAFRGAAEELWSEIARDRPRAGERSRSEKQGE